MWRLGRAVLRSGIGHARLQHPPRAVFEAAQRHGSILVTSASLRRKGWVVGLKAVGLVWSVLGHRGGPQGAPRRSQHLQRQGRKEEVPGRPTAELYHRLQPCHASEPPNRRHGLPRPRAAAIPPIRCGTRAIDEACSVIMVCAAPAAARRALAGCLTAAHGGAAGRGVRGLPKDRRRRSLLRSARIWRLQDLRTAQILQLS